MAVSNAYKEIMRILSEVEGEKGIPPGLLKEIYDMEADVVYLRSREGIYGDLAEAVSGAAEAREA